MKGTITKRISTSGTTTWGFGIDAGRIKRKVSVSGERISPDGRTLKRN